LTFLVNDILPHYKHCISKNQFNNLCIWTPTFNQKRTLLLYPYQRYATHCSDHFTMLNQVRLVPDESFTVTVRIREFHETQVIIFYANRPHHNIRHKFSTCTSVCILKQTISSISGFKQMFLIKSILIPFLFGSHCTTVRLFTNPC